MNHNELTDLVRSVLDAPRPWEITQVGEPVLRQVTEPYDGQLPEELLNELLDAMRAHLPAVGVGLAAPQIGIPLALAVVEDTAEISQEAARPRERTAQPLLELLNPVVVPVGEERRSFYEGCLSVTGFAAVVSRHRRIRLSATDRSGKPIDAEFTGWPARIVQHETDHLNGVLYLDRAETRSLTTMTGLQKHWRNPRRSWPRACWDSRSTSCRGCSSARSATPGSRCCAGPGSRRTSSLRCPGWW